MLLWHVHCGCYGSEGVHRDMDRCHLTSAQSCGSQQSAAPTSLSAWGRTGTWSCSPLGVSRGHSHQFQLDEIGESHSKGKVNFHVRWGLFNFAYVVSNVIAFPNTLDVIGCRHQKLYDTTICGQLINVRRKLDECRVGKCFIGSWSAILKTHIYHFVIGKAISLTSYNQMWLSWSKQS